MKDCVTRKIRKIDIIQRRTNAYSHYLQKKITSNLDKIIIQCIESHAEYTVNSYNDMQIDFMC